MKRSLLYLSYVLLLSCGSSKTGNNTIMPIQIVNESSLSVDEFQDFSCLDLDEFNGLESLSGATIGFSKEAVYTATNEKGHTYSYFSVLYLRNHGTDSIAFGIEQYRVGAQNDTLRVRNNAQTIIAKDATSVMRIRNSVCGTINK